jgi:hypothetical protein
MRKLISFMVLLLAAAVSYTALHKDTRVTQGPKPNLPCPPFCGGVIAQGPKPNVPWPCTGDYCNGITVSAIDWTTINARMALLLATREPAHVGGVPVR